ncbi:MAG: glutamine amidotransferase [Candidatus Saccharimonadales bacterium]
MNAPKRSLKLVHLYPEQMNIYGDWGNVLTIKKRAEWHGYNIVVEAYHPTTSFPKDADIIIGGGGQDSGQSVIQDDLLRIGDDLKQQADQKTPMLMICGLYQLFGHFFQTHEGKRIQGIGLFDLETYAGDVRMIGNIVTATEFGEVIGYENHSGMTVLGDNQKSFGTVIKGAGNNGKDKTEGAIYKNVYGSYLHGSLLPKNPILADALIEVAATKKYGSFDPQFIDDSFAVAARTIARSRPR